jgi:rhamnogalacturonan acetylesterase
MMKPIKSVLILFIAAFAGLAFVKQQKPTLYLTGDSTTRNSDKETWGWGSIIPNYFNLAKINIENHAMAGRSTHGRAEPSKALAPRNRKYTTR